MKPFAPAYRGIAKRDRMFKLVLGAVMISFAGVWVMLAEVGPGAAAFYRMLFAGLLLAGVVSWRREWSRLSRRLLMVLAAAAFAFALDLFFWHRSILYLGPGLSTLVVNFQVFILALAGVVLFGERPGWRLAAALPAALFGLGLIVGPERWAGEGDFRDGIVLALLAAVSYAAYILALRYSRGPGDERPSSALANMAVLCFFCAVMLGGLAASQGESLRLEGGRDWLVLIAYAITAQVLGWVLISRALEQVPASRVGLVLLLQPTLAFVWDVWFFDRGISASEALGAVIALAAIYLGATARTRAATPAPDR